MSDIQKLRIKAWDAIEFDENASVGPDDLLALLDRIDSAEKALKVATEEIEELRRFANNNGATIDEEKFVEGRAHLSQYGERT